MSVHPGRRARRAAKPARERRPKTKRISVALDEQTWARLRERARLHKVSQAAYVRAAINGDRPGGSVGELAAAADHWWDHLPPDRRASIHSWVALTRRVMDPDPAQLSILDELKNPQENP